MEIVHPDNRVEYELWYSSIVDVDYWRMKDLGIYQRVLNKDALFTPRLLTYACPTCSKEVKLQQCYSDGEYCVYYPKNNLSAGMKDITEMQLLEESLR